MTMKGSATQASGPALARLPLVLVADADTDTRALYRRAFEAEGYAVVEAADGREALIQALLQSPAVVVAELAMPHIDGLALCELLRADRQTATTPILIVTADARPAQLTRVRQAGGNALLVKPVSIDDLVTGIRGLVTLGPDPHGQDELNGEPADGHVTPDAPPPSRQRSLVKTLSRFATTAPPLAPIDAVCPGCDRPLRYQRSHVGGVSQKFSEQWDYFVCESCGPFQYRHRTRKLTPCAE